MAAVSDVWFAEDGGPFTERQVGGDDDRGPLVELADQVEEQLPAGLREGKIAEFVEHDEVEPGEVIGDPALLAAAMLGIEAIDEIDDVEEAAARAVWITLVARSAAEMRAHPDGKLRSVGRRILSVRAF
jgi:hypothetical protein